MILEFSGSGVVSMWSIACGQGAKDRDSKNAMMNEAAIYRMQRRRQEKEQGLVMSLMLLCIYRT